MYPFLAWSCRHMIHSHPLVFLSFVLGLLPLVSAARNVTFDDQVGNIEAGLKPTYHPAALWEASSCAGCAMQPDRARVFNGTFTNILVNEGYEHVSIEIPFSGTGIYVYFILPDTPGIAPDTGCNFTIDDGEPQAFLHMAQENPQGYMYDALVFASPRLDNRDHTLRISAEGGAELPVYINFDRAEFTVEELEPDQLSATVPTQTIIGVSIGGAALVLLSAILGLLLYRKRRVALSSGQGVSSLESQVKAVHDGTDKDDAASISSKSSFNSISKPAALSNLPVFDSPRYPGGYAPAGIPLPPQAYRVLQASGVSPTSPSMNGPTTRASTLSGYGILQRTGTKLTHGLRNHAPSFYRKLHRSPSSHPKVQARKAQLRQFEQETWRTRMEIREIQDEMRDSKDPEQLRRLQNEMAMLEENLQLAEAQQRALEDVPLSPDLVQEAPHRNGHLSHMK